MPDPVEVYKLKACGKEWKLHWNNHALRMIEGAIGCPIHEAKKGIAECTAMLWGGLLEHYPNATMATADAIIDDRGYESVVDVVSEGMLNAVPFQQKNGSEQEETASSLA